MTILILGLLLFLSVHSVRMVADGWRARQIARLGEKPWKAMYSLLSVLGLGLIIWGFGLSRTQTLLLWQPAFGMRHLTVLLTVPAFILLAAAYVPRNRIKTLVGHPMLLGVSIWALAHLLANGSLNGTLLFGAFLIWSALDFRAARKRDRAAGVAYRGGTLAGDVRAVVAGLLAWGLFAKFLHGWLIGVAPFG